MPHRRTMVRVSLRVGVVLVAALALAALAPAAAADDLDDRSADEIHVVCPEGDGTGHRDTAPDGESASDGHERLNTPSACEYRSVQDAVNDSAPGDLVYLQPGTYHQSASVQNVTNLTIAGAGRDETVLVGEKRANHSGHQGEVDGIYVTTNNVTVRDLEVREFTGDGVYYAGVTGFRVARVDAIDNGAYGIYAIRSTGGVFEDSYASGHFDSGFYLGEVYRCECTIRNVTAEANLIGYSGTGASYVTIENSTWVDNAAGIVPNVLPNEPAPQTNLRVVNNEIVDNNNVTAYREFHFAGSLHAPVGSGVIIGGGSFNTVANNTIANHTRAGVLITFMFTEPAGNAVVDNQFERNELDVWWDGGGANNCFGGNDGSDGGRVTFDAGFYWNTKGRLPACSETPTEGILDPQQVTEVAVPMLFGCEYEDLPEANLTNQTGCHVEEPAPHVHPPEQVGGYSIADLFGEAVRERIAEALT